MANTSNYAMAISCDRRAYTSLSAWAVTAKNKSWHVSPGRENLEDWKRILRGLIERGLRRVMIVIHDDFSGLLPVTRSLFPRLTFSFALSTCNVTQKRIYPSPTALSSSNVGGL